jgi:hypothetical protein
MFYGPRLFLNTWLKSSKVYNYFQMSGPSSTSQSENECPICYRMEKEIVPMDKIEDVPYLSSRAKDYIGKNNIQIMKTPCGHTFHAVCLLTSMSYRHACPVCKRRLPNVF